MIKTNTRQLYRLFELACRNENKSALRLAKRLEKATTNDEWKALLLRHAEQIRRWAVK